MFSPSRPSVSDRSSPLVEEDRGGWKTASVDHPHPGPHPSPLPEGEGEKAASALPWANRMPRRPRWPGAVCGRGIALVTGPGMRYDTAARFSRCQPLSADVSRFRPISASDVGHSRSPSQTSSRGCSWLVLARRPRLTRATVLWVRPQLYRPCAPESARASRPFRLQGKRGSSHYFGL